MNWVNESSDYKGFRAYLRGCRAPPLAGSIEGRLN
jgi:hypothetical protein